ncbi:hypothetical protein [Fictibacillus fluitans]|uniref:Uncharacterized protein n=1 Tax=Fictibacillus fluitans TaxID=3058422 RepID=A0ABT8I2X1_9BACL|nr:hypothetical protein [Fictibacillus sp. NE201]MDN4527368.1 hypothetical protein [Fictibacillus sp. NE201]
MFRLDIPVSVKGKEMYDNGLFMKGETIVVYNQHEVIKDLKYLEKPIPGLELEIG